MSTQKNTRGNVPEEASWSRAGLELEESLLDDRPRGCADRVVHQRDALPLGCVGIEREAQSIQDHDGRQCNEQSVAVEPRLHLCALLLSAINGAVLPNDPHRVKIRHAADQIFNMTGFARRGSQDCFRHGSPRTNRPPVLYRL